MTIKKGLYIIDDIHTYILDYDHIKDVNMFIDSAKKIKYENSTIYLNVDAKTDGYFVSSLPYDKGYKIYVDGKMIDYEKINTAFIGFKLNEGNHDIKIEFRAPGLVIGMILSLFGILAMVVYHIMKFKYKNTNSK